MATLALTNLDNGLYFDKGKWVSDHKLAQQFPDQEAVARAAKKLKVRNAAAALIDGNPAQVRGYFWVTRHKDANRV
ncbi:MAG TPA: hypothetical protein VKY92_02705 [Verrucomicrobiae bacterium]|nr:hypothetical protein [Verrucomicrobiae bacterium]